MVLTEDNCGSLAMFGCTVSQRLGILRGRCGDYCGKIVCVCAHLVFWLTAHLEADHLHLPVFHIGLTVRLHLKKAFSFWLKNVRKPQTLMVLKIPSSSKNEVVLKNCVAGGSAKGKL